ncbi:hypothetical protein DFJ74DRAFT_141044 [Hyaloraphidium curvatum]|nr:hypothetical protein DFJ74DRAFT_141044 [Hyaloraphidium curvatum]
MPADAAATANARILGLAAQLRHSALTDPAERDAVYDQTTWDTAELPPQKDDAYLEGRPLKEKSKSGRKLRIVCVGAGATGIDLVREWRRNPDVHGNTDLTLYEALPTHGGTWWINRYPGCACDVPSHLYSFSWAPNPNWSKVYSPSPEIWAYFDRCARAVGVPELTRYGVRIVSATWDEDYAVWRLKWRRERWHDDGSEWGRTEVLGEGEDWCDVLLNGTGALSKPKNPDIPGLDTFAGKKMHTGLWNNRYSVADKTVCQIGTGASGIQCFAEIQPEAKSVTVFQRTPSWITTYRLKGSYSREEKDAFARDYPGWIKFRGELWDDWEKGWDMFVPGSLNQKKMMGASLRKMENEVKDPQLRRVLTPSYPVGCRRLTPHETFLQRIQQPNVRLVTDPIVRIEPKGVVTRSAAGKEELHSCDVLVLATGFDTRFIPGFSITGRDGRKLDDEWADVAESYFSVASSGYPNFFLALGPNAPLGSNSALPILERTVKYVLRHAVAMRAYGIRSVDPIKSIQHDWFWWGQDWLKKTVWASRGCGGWYKRRGAKAAEVDDGGVIQAIYPGTTNSFLRFIEDVNWSHFNVEFEPGKQRPLSELKGSRAEFERDGGLSQVSTSWDWNGWDYELKLPA